MCMSPFNTRLRHWRKFRGWTQKELSVRSGIPRPNLIALEQGRRECTLTTLRRLAHALGISPGTLIDAPPPTRAQAENLDRHQIDQIARSLLGSGGPLSGRFREIQEEVSFQVAPLLRASGLPFRHHRPSKQAVVPEELVSQVSKRVAKLLASQPKEI